MLDAFLLLGNNEVNHIFVRQARDIGLVHSDDPVASFADETVRLRLSFRSIRSSSVSIYQSLLSVIGNFEKQSIFRHWQ